MQRSRHQKAPKVSPMHTPKDDAKIKQAIISLLGPDKDGAYRIRGRLDKLDRVESGERSGSL